MSKTHIERPWPLDVFFATLPALCGRERSRPPGMYLSARLFFVDRPRDATCRTCRRLATCTTACASTCRPTLACPEVRFKIASSAACATCSEGACCDETLGQRSRHQRGARHARGRRGRAASRGRRCDDHDHHDVGCAVTTARTAGGSAYGVAALLGFAAVVARRRRR